MPYPVIDQPSMALGLLKAALTAKGVSAKTFYPCVRFAEVIGLDVFSLIADSKQEFLIGEWTFAGAAFPDHKPDQDAYLRRVLSAAVSQGLLARSGRPSTCEAICLSTDSRLSKGPSPTRLLAWACSSSDGG